MPPNQGLAESATESHIRRARLAADTRNGSGVVENLDAAWLMSPSPEVANAAVDAFVRLGRVPDGVDWIQANVLRSAPGELWPWKALADMARGMLEPDDAEGHRLCGLLLSATDEWEAMSGARALLRKLGAWIALNGLLEYMSDRTLSIREQLAIHEELIEVVANKLSSPADAKPIRQRMERFKNIPELVSTYWRTIAEASDTAEVIDEAEAFFTVNRMWLDLETLSMQQLETARTHEAARWISSVELACASAEPPRWQELYDHMRVLAPRHPDMEARTTALDRAARELELSKANQAALVPPPEPIFPVWVLGLIAGTIGVGLAAIVIWRFVA